MKTTATKPTRRAEENTPYGFWLEFGSLVHKTARKTGRKKAFKRCGLSFLDLAYSLSGSSSEFPHCV